MAAMSGPDLVYGALRGQLDAVTIVADAKTLAAKLSFLLPMVRRLSLVRFRNRTEAGRRID